MGAECSKSDVPEIVEPEPIVVEPEPVEVVREESPEPVEEEREESPEPVENTPQPSIHTEPSIASSDDLNKASDFEELFITFESDSDEVPSLTLFLFSLVNNLEVPNIKSLNLLFLNTKLC